MEEDKEQGWIWSWGTDPRGIDTLGIATHCSPPLTRYRMTHITDDRHASASPDLLPVILIT